MSLVATLRAAIAAHYLGPSHLASGVVDVPFAADLSLASGTGANQADLMYNDTLTIAASGSTSIDLAGAQADSFGAVLTFVKIKAILTVAAAANVNNIIVGNGANPALLGFASAAHTWAIPPGGSFMVTAPAAGWPVTGATSDILKLANSGAGTGVTFDIVIIGTSA